MGFVDAVVLDGADDVGMEMLAREEIGLGDLVVEEEEEVDELEIRGHIRNQCEVGVEPDGDETGTRDALGHMLHFDSEEVLRLGM